MIEAREATDGSWIAIPVGNMEVIPEENNMKLQHIIRGGAVFKK